MPAVPEPFRVVEIFAGDAKLSKSTHYAEISTAMLDVNMGKSSWRRTRKAFDLLQPEGLALLVGIWKHSGNGCTCFIVGGGAFCPLTRASSQAGSMDGHEHGVWKLSVLDGASVQQLLSYQCPHQWPQPSHTVGPYPQSLCRRLRAACLLPIFGLQSN